MLKIVVSSGGFGQHSGGGKLYNVWAQLLRKNGYDAVIATENGTTVNKDWLVNQQPIVSYKDVSNAKAAGCTIKFMTGWLVGNHVHVLSSLADGGIIYHFDAETKYSMGPHLPIIKRLAPKLRTGVHSRYEQAWYMATFGWTPTFINEWSDASVFFDETSKRVPGRIGCLDSADRFEELKRRLEKHPGCESVIMTSGNEQEVADKMRTVDIFVGLNPPKEPLWGEGCPRTQQEAMHCGCALAAFDVKGNREYLYDGWTGMMAPANNWDVLERKVSALLDDSVLKEHVRSEGKNLVNNLFSEKGKIELVKEFLEL